MKLPYLSHKAYMQAHYGEPLYSIPVNLDFGCPNRDSEGKGAVPFALNTELVQHKLQMQTVFKSRLKKP